ncbi:MAG: hypothetical protein ACOZAM_20670 [Pseudomonadota bacterium]
MNHRRSMRVFMAVAILAAVFMIFAPFANLVSADAARSGPEMSAMDGCGMCPKSDMAMVNCAQVQCGLLALEASAAAPLALAPVRHVAAATRIPSGRHTIPPVSPG